MLTRFCETAATLIDHIMVKVPRKLIQTKVNSGNFIADIKDHLPNFVLINTSIVNTRNQTYAEKYHITKM